MIGLRELYLCLFICNWTTLGIMATSVTSSSVTRDSALDGFVFTTSVIFNTSTRSLVHSVYQCLVNSRCLTLTFTPKGRCQGHNTLLNLTSPHVQQSGALTLKTTDKLRILTEICRSQNYTMSGSLCLKLYNVSVNYEQAVAECAKNGGHLMYVKTQDDLDTLNQLLLQNDVSEAHLGFRRLPNNSFAWADGTPLSVNSTLWTDGEPQSDCDACGSLYFGGLNDADCATLIQPVCQIDRY